MILITKTTAGTGGPFQIRNYQTSGVYENTARLARSKLLNGGCSFSPYGTTDQDRDLDIQCRFSPAEVVLVKSLFDSLDPIKLAFWEGFFISYIYHLTIRRNGEAKIKFYIKEKLA